MNCPKCSSEDIKTIVKNIRPKIKKCVGPHCNLPLLFKKYRCKNCRYEWEDGQWTGKGFQNY
ncbi:MAG: hypothetical protein GF308_06510 [Candidatus Heimdallarchaeota archaeon]|nr:hypothetical protein [Candidatus Heimdallarchaeota archaeon]